MESVSIPELPERRIRISNTTWAYSITDLWTTLLDYYIIYRVHQDFFNMLDFGLAEHVFVRTAGHVAISCPLVINVFFLRIELKTVVAAKSRLWHGNIFGRGFAVAWEIAQN